MINLALASILGATTILALILIGLAIGLAVIAEDQNDRGFFK